MNLQLEHIDKTLKSKVRLGIMAVLTGTLENAGYIVSSKQFVGRIPNTAYRATEAGREAFRRHLLALEQLIEAATKGSGR